MDELQFKFDTPNAGASAFETEEMRRITSISLIVEFIKLLSWHNKMLVMNLIPDHRVILNKLFNKHVSGTVTLREIVTTLYFDKLDDAGRKILFDKYGIKENSRGIVMGGGKRMTKSKSKSYRKKSVKQNKKKYKSTRRVATSHKVVHRGGNLKDIWQNKRDKMLTKLGRQTPEKTEFKQLLREIERLRIFESEECDVFLSSLPNPNHIDEESNSTYMLDFLKTKFNSTPNGQAIIDVLIKLGLLYLKNKSTWDYKSNVDTTVNGKNMKYNCLMLTGVMIGERMKNEKESVLEKLKIIKRQTNELIIKTRQDKIAIMWELNKVNFDKDSPLQEEYSKLLTLLESLENRNKHIDAVILEITKSDYVDVEYLNSKFNCVWDTIGKQLHCNY